VLAPEQAERTGDVQVEVVKTVNVDPMLLLALSGSSSPIGRAHVRSEAVDALLREQQFPGLAINEFLCMSAAQEAGLPVPQFYLSDNAKLFVMRRFDRDEQLNPIGFEDMASLMGLSADQK